MLSLSIHPAEASHREDGFYCHDALGGAVDRVWLRQQFLPVDGMSLPTRLAGGANRPFEYVDTFNVVYPTVSDLFQGL